MFQNSHYSVMLSLSQPQSKMAEIPLKLGFNTQQ